MKEAGTNVAPELAAAYADAFAAYLADRGERELGRGLRHRPPGRRGASERARPRRGAPRRRPAGARRRRRPARRTRCRPAADFLRESLSIFESVHRGYREVQEVARIEHEHVEQLRALADASVALNSSLTVEEILQLTADAARTLIGGTRATVAIFAPDPRLRPLTATSPPLPADGEAEPARLTARLTGRGRELGMLEVLDLHDARVHRARRDGPHPARPARLGGDLQRPALRARADDRPDAAALAAPRRPARRARPVGGRALPPGRRERRARRRLLRPLRGRRRRLGGADRRRAGQGPGRRRGDRARPPHAARRRRLRAAAERRARAAAQGAARAAQRRALLHRRARAPADRQRAACRSSSPAAATRCRSSCTRTAAWSRSAGSARCSAPTSSRSSTTSPSSCARATCCCSTPTASPRCGGAGARSSGSRS